MSIENFKPALWAKLMGELSPLMVGSQFVNNHYEAGLIEKGKTLNIVKPGNVTIRDHVKNQDMVFEQVDATDMQLEITEAKYFAMTLDNLDKVQVMPGTWDIMTQKGKLGLAQEMDKHIFTQYQYADAGNVIPAITLTKDNILATIKKCSTNLNIANVPLVGRKMALSPHEIDLLIEALGINRGTSQSEDILTNGIITRKLGFDISMTNHLYVDTDAEAGAGNAKYRHLVYGHPDYSTTFAHGLSAVKAGEMEKQMGDYVKGVNSYGMLTTDPTALGEIVAYVEDAPA